MTASSERDRRRAAAVSALRHGAGVVAYALAAERAWQATPPDYVELRLDGALAALPPRRPSWQRLVAGRPAPTLEEMVAALDAVARDPRVRGAVLVLRALDAAPATRDALRAAIWRARTAGKRVVAWSARLDGATYPVACACDEILLQPGGGIAPLGVRRGFAFLADGLARVGLRFEAVRVSPYKTAPDVLNARALSPEARQMAEWLLEDAFADLVASVADGRGLGPEAARACIDATPLTDREAVAERVVDGILSAEDLPAHLGSPGAPARIAPWRGAARALVPEAPAAPGARIALLRVEGLIVDGESRVAPPGGGGIPLLGEARAGDLTVVAEVRRALADDEVAAAVLWIDSPGGSATASEAIAGALDALAARKPLVAVMGTTAASGGYYVASPAHHIVAAPGTLTGSIGVVAGKFVTAGLLDRLAVGRERMSRGANVDLWDGETTFTEAQRARVEASIDRTYERFVERVARSRGLSDSRVRELAGGRVWTGRQALAHGLVDALGDLADGAAEARRRARVPARAALHAVHAGRRPLGPVAPALAPAAAWVAALGDAQLLTRGGAWLLAPWIVDEG